VDSLADIVQCIFFFETGRRASGLIMLLVPLKRISGILDFCSF